MNATFVFKINKRILFYYIWSKVFSIFILPAKPCKYNSLFPLNLYPEISASAWTVQMASFDPDCKWQTESWFIHHEIYNNFPTLDTNSAQLCGQKYWTWISRLACKCQEQIVQIEIVYSLTVQHNEIDSIRKNLRAPRVPPIRVLHH